MPIRDMAAMNASLDNDYGLTHGPNAPDSHDLALFDGDPMLFDDDGVTPLHAELDATTAPGYGRVTIPNDAAWAAAADGAKALAAGTVQLPAPIDAWVEASHWALIADGVMWDCGPLTEVLEVTEAGDGPLVAPVVFYDDSVEPPD